MRHNNVHRRNNGNFVLDACCILVIILAIWTLFSWVEILCKNCQPYPEYNPWNIFVMFVSMFA